NPRTRGRTLFPYTTLFRSRSEIYFDLQRWPAEQPGARPFPEVMWFTVRTDQEPTSVAASVSMAVRRQDRDLRVEQVATLEQRLRSEEHTSELQSRFDLVCR